jgi:hypothetical protein
MEIKLQRTIKTNLSTIGQLYIGNVFQCNTLEDKDRGLSSTMSLDDIKKTKVQNLTAIPTGTYEVIIDHSTRFNKDMPHILNVPGFEGIRIHSGNTDEDTDGCILLGTASEEANFISNSRDAYSAFFPKLQAGLKQGKVYITIE